MELIKKLNKLKKQLVNSQVSKFSNGPFATIFNEQELLAISDDIILKMSEKIEKNEIDEQGIYNYFKTSFKYKCIDEIKKYNCQKRKNLLNSKEIDEVSFLIEDPNMAKNPLYIQECKETLAFSIDLLQNYENKKPLSKILNLILEGYSSSEIQSTLKISSSSLDRYKKEIIEIITPHNLYEPIFVNSLISHNPLINDDLIVTKQIDFFYKKFKFNKKSTDAFLYIKNEKEHRIIKKWKFNHKDIEEMNKIIDVYQQNPYLLNEEYNYVSK